MFKFNIATRIAIKAAIQQCEKAIHVHVYCIEMVKFSRCVIKLKRNSLHLAVSFKTIKSAYIEISEDVIELKPSIFQFITFSFELKMSMKSNDGMCSFTGGKVRGTNR